MTSLFGSECRFDCRIKNSNHTNVGWPRFSDVVINCGEVIYAPSK